ncbi:MAG TPA: four helix bundle protein [Pyrinomonadaceae bacterium]|jgi:four helix bundle protein|nr:four helix bundle protein [Pyrinomonadaceae bacterium]
MVNSGEAEKGARRFEELWVWQQARELVKEIYADFKSGPGSKDFGFRDQLQRAGVSVMNNIAEGFERSTDTEFARFLDVARSSYGEVRSMYYAAEDLGYVNSEVANARRSKARQISAGIASLASHLRKDT